MHKTITGVTVKDAEKGTIEAVFSTFNVLDKDGDVTVPGAIKDGTKVVISAYGHASWGGALPVGKGVIRTTDTEAIIRGQFFMDTTHGSDTFKTVAALAETDQGEWSYSLRNVTAKAGEFNGEPANFLESIEVNEVSPVLIGSGVNTRTLSAKGLKFTEEGAVVVAAVDAFLKRAGEVMVLRAAKGRTLGDDSTEHLLALKESLTCVDGLLKSETESAEADEENLEDIKAIAAEARRRDLFSNLPDKE
jgi:hypothetical protein